MNQQSNRTSRMRRRTKLRVIEAFGGKCGICGYNKCNSAIDIHHVNPNDKEFSMSQVKASNRNWSSLVVELRKCVMLCCRCHREIHEGLLELPNDIVRFDEKYSSYKNVLSMDDRDYCPSCGKLKSIFDKYCSKKCSGGASWKVDWDNIDLRKMMLEHGSYAAVGMILGVHGTSVKKQAVKIGIVDIVENGKEFVCKRCDKKFYGRIFGNRKFCSRECSRLDSRKVIRPAKNELQDLINRLSLVKIGKMFGVSDNAVRKWIKQYKIMENNN